MWRVAVPRQEAGDTEGGRVEAEPSSPERNLPHLLGGSVPPSESSVVSRLRPASKLSEQPEETVTSGPGPGGTGPAESPSRPFV